MYQQTMEAYQQTLKDRAEEERREKEAAAATAAVNAAGQPPTVDLTDDRPYELVSGRKKKSPTKLPNAFNRYSAESRAARQGLAHSVAKDIHMELYVALPPLRQAHLAQPPPPYRLISANTTPSQQRQQLPVGAGVQQYSANAPPAISQLRLQPTAPPANEEEYLDYPRTFNATPHGQQQQQQQLNNSRHTINIMHEDNKQLT